MADDRPLSADRVPTLTEVVELAPPPVADMLAITPVVPHETVAVAPPDTLPVVAPDASSLVAPPIAAAPAAPPLGAAAALPDTDALVTKVLSELSPRIDMMFEARLREALAPALARAADGLIRETRGDLSATLRELVEEAVVRALHRRAGH